MSDSAVTRDWAGVICRNGVWGQLPVGRRSDRNKKAALVRDGRFRPVNVEETSRLLCPQRAHLYRRPLRHLYAPGYPKRVLKCGAMTTYVFGAGASIHAGYPLAKDLGASLLAYADTYAPGNYIYWLDPAELRRLFPNTDEDFEGLISELEEPSPGSQIAGLPLRKRGAILAGIRNVLCEYFDSVRHRDASEYRRFASERAREQDTIITFNYDVSLERELRSVGRWEISDGYGFDICPDRLPRSPTKVLKLHGSTSWIDLLFNGSKGPGHASHEPRGPRPVVIPQEFQFLGYDASVVHDRSFKGGGTDRRGSMILPGRHKRFFVGSSINAHERRDFWKSLWSQAALALANSDAIVIQGYSFPEADENARRLLFEGSNRRALLTISCGSATSRIRQEFRELGFTGVVEAPERFEDYLARQIRPRDPFHVDRAYNNNGAKDA